MVARGLGRDSFGFGGLSAESSFPRSCISRALCRTLAAGEAGREEGRLCCPAANAAEMATVGGWNLVQLANPSSLKIEVMVLTSAPLAVLCTVHPNTVWTLQAQGAIQSVAVRLEGACAKKRAIHGGAGGGRKRQQTAPYPPRSRSWSSWSERMDLASDAMPPYVQMVRWGCLRASEIIQMSR